MKRKKKQKMDKVNSFLILVLAAVLMAFGYYALNNKPTIETKTAKIDSVLVKEIIHDSIYKTKVVIKRDSFVKYVTIRDSVLKDSTKIDSVLATKVDTTANLKVTAIVLADSLSTCKDELKMANDELDHDDSVFAVIDSVNKQPIKKEFDYKTASISYLGGLLTFLLFSWLMH